MTKLKLYLLVILLIIPLVAVHGFDRYLGRVRAENEMSQPTLITHWREIPLQELTGIVLGALFGGFRSQAADIIWWKSAKYWEDGHWDRVWPMVRATCYLDPYFKDAWIMLGWHEAYNMAAEAEIQLSRGQTPDRYPEDWVRMGIASYREGLKYNSGAEDLYEDLAWTAMDKLGDQESGARYIRMAQMTWRRGPTETRETDKILARLGGHAWEQVPEIDEALDAYDRLLDTYPTDPVGIGATVTIRERYLPAWRANLARDYGKALELIDQRLQSGPRDKIGLHLKALIQETSGDQEGAFVTWVTAAWHPRDRFAHHRLAQILRSTGRYQSMPGFRFADLASTRLIAEYASRAGGMGVTLNLGGQSFGGQAALEEGQTVSMGLPSSGPGGPSGRARVFINGFEVADIQHPPWSFQIDLRKVRYDPTGLPEFLLHVEFTAPDQTLPAWDVRLVMLPWAMAPPPKPPSSPPGDGLD